MWPVRGKPLSGPAPDRHRTGSSGVIGPGRWTHGRNEPTSRSSSLLFGDSVGLSLLAQCHGSPGAGSKTQQIMTPRRLFENLAEEVWQRLDNGNRLGVSQGETSLTDYLLLQIALLRSPSIRVLKTPITDENVQGTDWEWWIGTPQSGWLRYAVQAKKLDLNSGRYNHLGHLVNGELQASILRRFAETNRAIPAYCLYNYVKRDSWAPYWHCQQPGPLVPQQLGCSITSLQVVEEALQTKGARCFDWIHRQLTLPWRCLLRCPAFISPFVPRPPAGPPPGQSPSNGEEHDGNSDRLGGISRFFKIDPVLYPSPPRELIVGSEREGTDRLEDFEADFYNRDLGLFPNYVALINLAGSSDFDGIL